MTQNQSGEQATPAAERSADVTRGTDPKAAARPGEDSRPAYWVEVLDTQGRVVRQWQTRLEDPPVGLAVRIRPV